MFLHTHVGEGESPVIAARHGMRTVDYLEEIGFAGPDTFYAHCWELTHDELRKMAASRHRRRPWPEPVYLVGAEVTDIPAMADFRVAGGLGCDGAAWSNDNSNLMHCVHSAYMLQCLAASTRAIRCRSRAIFSLMGQPGAPPFWGAATSAVWHPAWRLTFLPSTAGEWTMSAQGMTRPA